MIITLLACALLQEAPITPDKAGKVKQAALLEGHKMPVFGLAISPDGKRMATAGLDGSIQVWGVR